MDFYAQGAHRALMDLGLEKEAAWPTLIDIPAMGNRLLKPIMAHLEKREARQGLERLRKALPSARPGSTPGSVDLTVPGNGLIFKRPARNVTVSADVLEEALGAYPLAARRTPLTSIAPTAATPAAVRVPA